ncbi:hypothetical protein L3X38_036845 [Prunus dulcis]|uniref:Reverse transcriptase Ty1/copia-type domain-containing protein n=1 Tax=Prunus dulcis TaxID=3755 RepID=A0AAD4YQQ8_PRUDU|nr:hypothetical protein L3X38_036845 [Prunus dulcis]
MKDLGDLKYFLGIEVARSTTGTFLSQRKYVLDLLTETGMLGCKPVDTPIEMNHKLCEDIDQELTNKEQYQRLVERYLKSAPGKGLTFAKNRDLEVVGYTDADWAGSVTDRRSTSSYFTFVECPDGSTPIDADFDTEPDPESGSSFDDPDLDPDPDYDDDDPDPDSEDDPDPHSDDDPNPEFVSDSDPDPDFDSDFGPDSGSDSDPNFYSTCILCIFRCTDYDF